MHLADLLPLASGLVIAGVIVHDFLGTVAPRLRQLIGKRRA